MLKKKPSMFSVISGGPRGGARLPLFWIKSRRNAEGRKTSRASKSKPPLPPLAQGLDQPLATDTYSILLAFVFPSYGTNPCRKCTCVKQASIQFLWQS